MSTPKVLATVTDTSESVRCPSAPPAPIERSHWRALPVLMAGTFLIVLDFFIVNVALPSMQAELHASASVIEWVVAGYGLTLACFLLTAGRIGDHVGRRRVFSTGLALFVLASAVCGIAPDSGVLVLARLAQGAAAALISPSVLAIIGVIYTGPARVRAISIYGIVMGLAAVSGQIIGGLLIQADIAGSSWRAVFLINVPVGLVALALAPRLVPESRADNARRVDLVGMGLATLALTAVVLPLLEGRTYGWPSWAWASLGAAPVLLVALALHQRALERQGRQPLLDPTLFRVRAFSAGLVTQLALWCGQAPFFLVLALYLQQGRRLTPLQAGSVFTVLAAAYLVTSLRAPALTLRYGRSLITLGASCLALGHGLLLATVLHIGVGGSVAALIPGLVLVGAGQGLCITPLTTTVLAHADPQRAGAVSGTLSTMQQVGNALGVAVTGVVFFGTLGRGYAHAFGLSLGELACLLTGVAALTRLLPRIDRRS